jgi:hypothetical protein
MDNCISLSSTNKTDRHDITEMLLKVVLNTINHHTVLLSIINQSTIKFTFQNLLEKLTIQIELVSDCCLTPIC